MHRTAPKAHRRPYHKVYVPGTAALLVALAAGGCTVGGGGGASPTDAKAGDPSVSLPVPGKYRTLREPCGTVPLSTLKDLLPGVSSLPADQRERVFQGTPAVTYDTDRRVGCSWKADSPSASHRLSVDIERVVSYDPAVSDADRAEQVYAQRESQAHVTASGAPSPPASSGTAGAGGGVLPSGPPSGTPSTGTTDEAAPGDGLPSRELGDIGDAAFVDDVLTQSGSATEDRTVSVVFRTSNVIVTVTYTQQPTHPDEVPDSKELQDRAQALAKKLVDAFDE